MRELSFAHGASVCPAMLARGAGWGICAGAFFGLLSAVMSILVDPQGSVMGLVVFLAIAGVIGAIVGSVSGLGLGLLGGGLLGLWTSTHPRPVATRAAYRMQATPVVGLLMGGAVAFALSAAILLWTPEPPPYAQSAARYAVEDFVYVAIVAIQAGLAAGWSTCRILGWYAAQPE